MRAFLVFLLLFAIVPARAEVTLTGTFTATDACPALQSIKKGTNPGNISTAAGASYPVFAKNKEEATHYWIGIDGVAPARRWVSVKCGHISSDTAATPTGPASNPAPSGDQPFYILSISWEPAFCEGLPHKAECKAQTATSFEATHFSLHGLWPQPRGNEYCGVETRDRAADQNHRWDLLPEPRLTNSTQQELAAIMPGTQSLLERHEWIRHGTCYPAGSSEIYFLHAIKLMKEINGSAVQAYFSSMIGKTVRLSDIRARFDASFGPGAGERVRVACKDDGDRRLITELTIGLKGDPGQDSLAQLIQASSQTDGGCTRGEIDASGLQ